jgi:F0F1-type ATP synthase membrane subunit b/b'
MLSFVSPLLEKSARLKQAKEEAEKEIAEYRAKLEAEFQKKVSDVSVLFDNTPSYP